MRTELRLEGGPGGELTEAGLRRGVRCIRLTVYSPDEAAFALRSGHLDAPIEQILATLEQIFNGKTFAKSAEADPTAKGSLLPQLLQKDSMIFSRTAAICDQSLSGEQVARQRPLLDAPGVSADLRAAIGDETSALLGCARLGELANREITVALHRLRDAIDGREGNTS